ncbi:MAG TPA: NAD-dependent epimerase/dehydratase family protein [Anaerolineales bacterium]|nr:NAD-dependent epimerase/dehydratase family protein [Anaerolineales bacterium]
MTTRKNVFVVGGTGFLGYHAILEFLRDGWSVTAIGLPPAPPPDLYPRSVKVILKNLDKATDEELLALLHGHDALVFAAGLDDRYTPKKPSYPKFHHANVEVPVRLLNLAKQAGVKRAAVLGSYFVHFDRLWPEMKLSERHPYIRSRLEQEKAVTSIPGLAVNVLELPYIFGSLPVRGWKPLWAPLVKYLRAAKTIFYMRGGTACITAETVGKAILGAVKFGEAGKTYPIGDENLSWTELLTRLAAADNRQVRVVALPAWLVRLGLDGMWLLHQIQGREGGLDPRFFAPLQTAKTFLDPQPSRQALHYETGGLNEAFRKTVEACNP